MRCPMGWLLTGLASFAYWFGWPMAGSGPGHDGGWGRASAITAGLGACFETRVICYQRCQLGRDNPIA